MNQKFCLSILSLRNLFMAKSSNPTLFPFGPPQNSPLTVLDSCCVLSQCLIWGTWSPSAAPRSLWDFVWAAQRVRERALPPPGTHRGTRVSFYTPGSMFFHGTMLTHVFMAPQSPRRLSSICPQRSPPY